MTIVVLIRNAGIEKMTAFIEVIKLLEQKKINTRLIIAFQPVGYQHDEYYKDNRYVKIEALHEGNLNTGFVENIKNIIRKNRKLEKFMTDVLTFFKAQRFWRLTGDKEKYIYDNFLSEKMKSYLPAGSTDFIWATDEYGLLWAEWINNHIHKRIKVVYHCLELYWEHYLLTKKKNWRYYDRYFLFETVRAPLLKSFLIIIQDEDRWGVLCKHAGLKENHSKAVVPVSIKDYEIGSGRASGKKWNVDYREKHMILYSTQISFGRGCVELADNFKQLPEKYILLIHGFQADPECLDKIKEVKASNVIISNDSLEYMELLELHRDIWCGFLFYGESDNNDKYIANSSNKLVMLLQAGKPIITLGNQSLRQLCAEYRCGVALNNWSGEELRRSVSEIDSHYSEYCANAYRCYRERFDIALYAEELCGKLDGGCGSD